jgi:putative transposase
MPLPKRQKVPTVQEAKPTEASKPQKPPPGKARRIKLYPSQTQRKTLRTWFGAVRWTYNQTIEWINNRTDGTTVNIKDIRAHCVNVEKMKATNSAALEVPYDVRDDGARDAVKAYALNIAKAKKCKARGDAPHKFKFKFRSIRDQQETISIHSKYWASKRGMYGDLFGLRWCDMESAEDMPYDISYDSRLIRTRLGEYYLCVPMQIEPRARAKPRTRLWILWCRLTQGSGLS